MTLRDAVSSDSPALAAVYGHWVEHSVATFDLVAPDVEHWSRKVADSAVFLVAEEAGQVVGFAYAGTWRPKPAYDRTVEDTIYLAPGHLGRGHGRALLGALLERLRAGGYEQVLAVLTDSGDPSSFALHASFGFTEAGRLRAVGHKHGRVLDTVVLQLSL